MEPKLHVLRSFLEFVSRRVPLPRAKLATLGGWGTEAKLWKESGVPPGHGWLVEVSHRRRRNLIHAHRYRIHNRLGTLAKVLAGAYGEKEGVIDAFHLDLCGTFRQKVVDDFRDVLPLVLNSQGRMLAITVADQRANMSLENWPKVRVKGKKLFKARTDTLFKQLLGEQSQLPRRASAPVHLVGFDPNNGAKREFGLLVELADLLRKTAFVPSEIVRYVYVSHNGERPFRMRTFFFRFEKGYARDIADVWLKSPLYFEDGAAFVQLGRAAPKKVLHHHSQPKGETRMASKLETLAKTVGGDVEAEYNRLRADADKFGQMQTILNGAGAPNGAHPTAGAGGSPTRAAKLRREWHDLPEREQLDALVMIAERKAQSNGHWDKAAWKSLVSGVLGRYTAANGRSIRSALAHTTGKFRPNFISKVRKVFGADAPAMIDRLPK